MSNDSPQTPSPWVIAWCTFLPFGVWLIFAKLWKVAYTITIWQDVPSSLPGILSWIASYAWAHVLMALLAAYVLCRLMRRSLLWMPMLFVAVLVSMALFVWPDPGRSLFRTLGSWVINAALELNIFATVAWRELLTTGALALVLGTCLKFSSAHWRPRIRAAAQVLVVFLCVCASVDLGYLMGTGQPFTYSVLAFSSQNFHDLIPLIAAEMTPTRTALLLLGAVFAIGFFLWHRHLIEWLMARRRIDRGSLVAAAIAAVALLLPVWPAYSIPFERFSEGSLLAFGKSAMSSLPLEAKRRVDAAFDKSGVPPWYSAGLRFVTTTETRPRNVVIVMMESMRAKSTTMYDARFTTMPFLNDLSRQGMRVEDMSAVVPRTAGAWLAILGGQYPLTNEGTSAWKRVAGEDAHVRGLPSALHEQGYVTAFFTPTGLGLLNELALVKALGFDQIVSETELHKARPDVERVNYIGLADDVMVPAVVQWARAQKQQGRPFMAALMTNVGHHPYTTPASWPQQQFAGSTDKSHQAYLNCLRYIDGVLASLMSGFEAAGLTKDTIFVFVGDHGTFFGEHGIRQAFNGLYQEGVHIPTVIYAPGLIAPGTVITGPRQQPDFLPTLAQLLGYRVEGARLPGVSLLSPPVAGRTMYFSGTLEASFLALRLGQRKYIYDFGRTPVVAFDLQTDPEELKPLDIGTAERDTAVREMLEWQASAMLSMFVRPVEDSNGGTRWARR